MERTERRRVDQRSYPVERRWGCHREVQRCAEPGESAKRNRNHRRHHNQYRPGGGGRAATTSSGSRANPGAGASNADSTDTDAANAGTDADSAVTDTDSAGSDTPELHLFRLADSEDDVGVRRRRVDRRHRASEVRLGREERRRMDHRGVRRER